MRRFFSLPFFLACACSLPLVLAAPGCDDASTDADGGIDGDGGPGLDGGHEPVDAGDDPDDGGPPSDGGPVDAGPPDAGPPEPCASPGAVETVACGMCGTVERFCTAGGTWAYGVCEDEGECAPGATGSAACGMCGMQATRCTASCTWESTGACTGEGECAPGTMTRSGTGCPAGQQRDVTCSDACAFEPTSACTADGCDTPGRIESVPCGSMCGTQERFCNVSRMWEYGACSGEGVCVPGTTGSTTCGMCGTRTTLCNDTCAWVTSGACSGEGVCVPGSTRRTSAGCSAGATRLMECDASCGYTIEVEPCRTTVPIDVLFLVDMTPSNSYDFRDQRTTFVPRCVDALLALTDVQVGIAYYGDLSAPSEPFAAGVQIGAGTSAAISSSVMSQADMGGAEDATMEALHILTGAAPVATGSLPFTCSAGRVAGGCWRPGAERVIVLHTDEAAKSGPLPTGTGLYSPWPTGPTWTTVLPRLMTDGTLLFPILDDDWFSTGSPVQQYQRMVTDLGQPATDAQVEGPTEPGIGVTCDAIVARVRTIAGL